MNSFWVLFTNLNIMIKLRTLVCKFYFQDYHEVSDERVNTCKKNCFYASTWFIVLIQQGPYQFLTSKTPNEKKFKYIRTKPTLWVSQIRVATHTTKKIIKLKIKKNKKKEEEGSKNVYIHTEMKLPSSFIIIINDSQSLLNKNFSLIHKTWASKW